MEKGNDLSDPEISSELGKVISDDRGIVELFNDFLCDIVTNFKILPRENYEIDVGNDNEPILNHVNKFENHPTNKMVKSRKKEFHF